jgi:hypothetical protein
MIDLIQPPITGGAAVATEIYIDDAYTPDASLNYGQNVVGDTGDHSFTKRPEALSEIQEEEAITNSRKFHSSHKNEKK